MSNGVKSTKGEDGGRGERKRALPFFQNRAPDLEEKGRVAFDQISHLPAIQISVVEKLEQDILALYFFEEEATEMGEVGLLI